MSGELRAIETVYQGYRFRSRTEARWATFFDALGVKWQYEVEGFELRGGVRYLPDFWLPDLRCYVEIKGQKATEDEIAKARALSEASGCEVYIFDCPDFTDPRFTALADELVVERTGA